ncbi:MAG: RnfABCDGE type electron transport complex subunit G [Lachnospiraceae bacterium]|nr:RnfABCDGE type electron transport complex subunit G [Lachnospiraceae bacterium]
MKSMIKDAAILFAITLISGLLLGVVYEVTKEPIAVQKALRKNKACKEVFQEAVDFRALELSVPETLEAGEKAAAAINGVSEAVSEDGAVLGYVLDITTHEGYNGDIQFTMGIKMDGTVNGISLLSIAETPGLGMKAEDVLKPQFAGKKVGLFAYTKTGAATPDQIDAISGATITTNALVNGVNTGLDFFKTELGGGKNE